MKKRKFTLENLIYFFVICVIIGYLISIFAVNLIGSFWSNFDIYSDAILAKYMWQEHTLFPEGWYFGNQIYTVATPAVAALLYGIVKDTYLALALASCLMTIGIVASYIWCLKPFVNAKGIIISLLVLIGGTNVGFTAHADWGGLQVFYTMASYYACYVIGILLTTGVYFRLANNIAVHALIQFCVLLYNCALGMQSLRELLVLNLPLCAIVILDIILHHNNLRNRLQEKRYSYIFAFVALIANIIGVLITKLLTLNGVINQTTILSTVSSDILYNFRQSISALTDYIGLIIPTSSREWLELAAAIISIAVIFLVLIYFFTEYKKSKSLSVLGYDITFFIISILAVFCAGLFIIFVRDIYFFCWYLLVATSVAIFMQIKCTKRQPLLNVTKYILIISLLIVSILNYKFTFYVSFNWAVDDNTQYQKIVNQLLEDDIHYLYSDWRTDKNMISAVSHDEIQYGTLSFSGNPDDLWLQIDYLYHEDWFVPENFNSAYIILSDYTLYCLECEFSSEYRTALMDNLEYVYSFRAGDQMLHFYLGSDKMYADMIQ